MKKDEIFKNKQDKKFEFDEKVASVFDDMLNRSIPFYNENLNLISEFLALNLNNIKNPRIYDLGCSNANMLLKLAALLKTKNKLDSACLIGLDTSKSMLKNAELKAKAYGVKLDLKQQDILEFEFKKANAFIANFTLQFIRPFKREKFIKKIFDSLKKNGVFVVSEKMSSSNKALDSQMIEIYHNFKLKNGYSVTEIATKREALENVLIPYTLEENLAMLKNAGFNSIEIIFKWNNFGTLLAKKD